MLVVVKGKSWFFFLCRYTIWPLFALLSLSIFAISLWKGYTLHQSACSEELLCDDIFYLTADQLSILNQIDLPVSFYSGVIGGFAALSFLSFFAVSWILFRYGSNDPVCYTTSIVLLSTGSVFTNDGSVLEAWPLAVRAFEFQDILFGLSYLLLFLYPDGTFTPRWTKYFAVYGLFFALSTYFAPSTVLDMSTWPIALRFIQSSTLFALIFYSQIYRYKRTFSAEQRQRTIWFIGSIALYMIGSVTMLAVGYHPVSKLFIWGFMHIGLLSIPFSVALTVIEQRSRRMETIFNRSIVYAVLSFAIVSVFALATGMVGAIFQTTDNWLASLLTIGIISIVLQPLRDKVQKAVNRLIYGVRAEPYQVVSNLIHKLEAVVSNRTFLPLVLESLAEGLRLSYAAIKDNRDRPDILLASYGTPVAKCMEIPLSIQDEPVGTLILGSSAIHNIIPPNKRYLFDDLIRQVAIATRTALLSNELQRSREQLVSAREEERRRLRRDLHDGLGSNLASISMKLATVIDQFEGQPTKAESMLVNIQRQLDGAIEDIRRLVYALRPPSLDEFGLLFALRELAAHSQQANFRIIVHAPDSLPPLMAAVEAAVFRIVQEAIANALRHSQGTACHIRLSVDETLRIQIADNGIGMSGAPKQGVGIRSMRERAEELNGRIAFQHTAETGTRIEIEIPLITRPQSE
ncbi:sensor histidine kinase [Paenibacillus nanensis]|nr:sensor histidine kinase [Paenibacillus nanensis]